MKIKILFLSMFIALFVVSCEKPTTDIPAPITKMIEKAQSEPVRNPPVCVMRYVYQNETVYFFTGYYADVPSRLYNSEGEIICSPCGGIGGKGDGLCPDFYQKAKRKKLLWEDPRTYPE